MPIEMTDAEVFGPAAGELSDADVFGPEKPGVLGGMAASLERGVRSAQMIAPTLAMAASPQIDKGRAGAPISQQHRAWTQAMEDPRYLSWLSMAGDDPAQMAKVESLFGPGRRLEQLSAPRDAIRQIWSGVVADMATEREKIPRSQAQQELADARTSGDKWAVFRKYPGQVVSSIVLESLPPSLAGAVVGGAAGPAGLVAGVGLASASQEFANEFLGEAQRKGYDPTKTEDLARFLTSPDYNAAVEKALTRASIVGGVDAATAGMAGRFIGPALKLGLAKVAVATGKEIGMQAVGGAGGEFFAQAATKGDQPFDWFDVAMEGVSEVVTGTPTESFSNVRSAQKAMREPTIDLPPVPDVKPTMPAPAVQVTPDALAELQAAMRGNQLRPAPSPLIPKQGPELVQPPPPPPPEGIPPLPPEQAVTQEDLANRELVRRMDEEAKKFIEKPDKSYESMTDDELQMLAALGDGRARSERRRRKSAAVRDDKLATADPQIQTVETAVKAPEAPAAPEQSAPAAPPARVSVDDMDAIERELDRQRGPAEAVSLDADLATARRILTERNRLKSADLLEAGLSPERADKVIDELERRNEIARGRGGRWIPNKPPEAPKLAAAAPELQDRDVGLVAPKPPGPPETSNVQPIDAAPEPATVPPVGPSAPETITGSNEGKASEMPAEAGEVPAHRRSARRGSTRPPDLIDWIEANVGHIKTISASTPGNESLYEGWQELRKLGAVRRIMSASGKAVAPDIALQAAIDARQMPDGASTDDFRDAIRDAALARRGDRQTKTAESKALEAEEQQYEAFRKTGINRRNVPGVPVTDLIIGDEFTLNGTKVKVADFVLDEDTQDVIAVILEDGARFGVQRVGGQEVIRPDKGSLKREEAEFGPVAEAAPAPKPQQTPPPPTIKPGQRQGDLLSGGDVEFNLYGEKTGDGDRAAREAEAAAQAKREGEEFARKNQGELGAPSQAARSRPVETVVFPKPIKGTTGVELISYKWEWVPEEYVDKRGEDRVRRVSNWDESEPSETTGRDLVHKFQIRRPSGETAIVSSEGALSELGFLPEQKIAFKNLASTAKTLAKLRMQEQQLEPESRKWQEAWKKAQAVPFENITSEKAVSSVGKQEHYGTIWRMGPAFVIEHKLDSQSIPKERREALESEFRISKMRQLGFEKNPWRDSAGEELASVRKRIKRAEEKLKTASEATTDKVERALDALKIDTDRKNVQAFGLLPEVWNQVIELVRTAYRAGKSIKAAVDSAIEWAKKQGQEFDELAARKELENVIPSDLERVSPQARIAELETQMRETEARGEPIPAEMLQDYVDAANELGEEQRAGRTGRPAAAQVDENLEANEGAPSDPQERPQPPERRIPPFRGAERLPGSNPLRDVLEALANWRQRTGDWWSRSGTRMDITIGRDAGDNRATRAANQASLQVRLILNRAFGAAGSDVRTKNALREAALTFVVEADGNRDTLAGFYDEIASSEHATTTAGKRALAAIEFADTHWDKFTEAAARYKVLTTTEREIELNEGVNSHEWEGGYVFHQWKREPAGTGADPTQARPAATPFRRPRSVESYAAGIAAGRVPVTFNALELLAGRVDAGQKRLNELRWIHGLRSMLDPVTDLPVAVDVIRKARRPVGLPRPDNAEVTSDEANGDMYRPEMVSIAPEGYVVWRSGDLELAIHENFAGLLTKLTAPSFFKGAAAKKAFGFVKSALLMFDTFHLGRMAAWRQMFGLGGGYQKGQTLLDFTTADIREMAARGEIPEGWTQGLLENKRLLELAVDTGFNVGNVLDNAWSDALHNLPGIGTFNKWLFGQYQRGAMAESWLIEFNRLRRAMPRMSERALARQVSRDLNARFGNLNRQGLFKSRTGQDLARFVFLAPQWNESLIRSELGAGWQALRAPVDTYKQRRIVAGTLMKATGMMALGTFVANQILNYAFRGKPTWDNDEEGWDKKISAWIPDVISGGPGFFLNPLALPAEYTHLIEGNLHRSGGDATEATLRILNSRLNPISRAVSIFASRRDVFGQQLRGGEVLPAMAKAMIPAPIASGTIAAAGKQIVTGEPGEQFPGQYQKQIMASFGMKTDQAPNAEQRIRTLARDFNAERGITPSAEFFAGDFTDLDRALRIGNMSDAKTALEEVMAKKKPQQIAEHYKRWVAAPFTGQKARESEFWRGLTPEQRARYTEAREQRRKVALKAIELLREAVSDGTPAR